MMLVKMMSKVEVSQSLGQSDQSQQLVSKQTSRQAGRGSWHKRVRKKKFQKQIFTFSENRLCSIKEDQPSSSASIKIRLQCKILRCAFPEESNVKKNLFLETVQW